MHPTQAPTYTAPCFIQSLAPDTGERMVAYVHRVESGPTTRNGNTGRVLYCTDRTGRPVVLLIPGDSSYTHSARPGCWYDITFGGRCPPVPYDGRVSSLHRIEVLAGE